jgi:hypothetical protein
MDRPTNSISDLKTLPVAELLMGLALFVLCTKMHAGAGNSLARAGFIFLICALITVYGILRNPYAPFYVYAIMAPTVAAMGTVYALILGGTIAVFLNHSKVQWKWQFSWAGVGFCLWTFASFTWGERLAIGVDSFLAQALAPMALAIVISGIRDRLFRRNLVLLVVAASTLGSVACLLNWSRGAGGFVGNRIFSFIPPDIFTTWGLFGLMSALAWLLEGKPAIWLRWLLICSVPIILMGIGLCGYRAAILSALVGVLVVGICQKRWFQGVLLLVTMAMVAGSLYLVQPGMFTPVLSRFQTIHQDRGSERLDIWEVALKVFEQSPIIGVGCDNFGSAVQPYYGAEFLAHSVYIGTLVELGIVGTVLMLYWFIVLLRKTWRAQERLWVFPLLVIYFFQGAFLHQFYFAAFWLAIGLAEGSCSVAAGVKNLSPAAKGSKAIRLPFPRRLRVYPSRVAMQNNIPAP